MRSARKTLLWLSMLGLLLCMGAGQSALAESSIHQLNWNGSTSSAINMDKFSMAASQNLAQSMQVTQVTFSGSKTLLGRDMEAGEFAFLLGDDHGNTLQRLLSNPSPDGVAATFTSNTLYFDKPGTYTFHLWEEVGRLDSVVYDPVSYAIQVTVTQDAQGGLSQTHTIQAGGVVQNAMAFTNTYATTTYSATKKWIYPEGVTPPTGHTHPSVDLQLYRDGEAYSPGGLVEMLPANGTVDGGTTSLTHTWNNLPRYRADGALNADGSRAESVYSFKEVLVPDGYVKMRPADAPDTVENIYWPGVRTLHKLWVGPAPQPTAGGQSLVDVTITQQIYGENGTLITSIPYSIDPPNAFVIAMDGIADTFPNPAPTDPYKLYGEFTPWTYTIGLPSNGTYGGQPVNFDYTFNETKIPGDYMMQGTTTHAAQGVDTITNAYAFTSFIATKQWVGGPEDNRPPVTIRLQHRFINDIGEPTVDDVRDSNGNAIVVVLDGTDDGKPTGEMAPLDKNTWRYRWDKLPRYVRGDLFPDDQREYTYTFIENAVAIERYYSVH